MIRRARTVSTRLVIPGRFSEKAGSVTGCRRSLDVAGLAMTSLRAGKLARLAECARGAGVVPGALETTAGGALIGADTELGGGLLPTLRTLEHRTGIHRRVCLHESKRGGEPIAILTPAPTSRKPFLKRFINHSGLLPKSGELKAPSRL